MRKKEIIIRTLKAHIKLVVIISAILISGLVFLIVIYIPSIEESKKEYIATDDSFYSGHDFMETFNGNKTYLIAGRYNTDTGSAIYYTFIKFDLTNKPKIWNNLEVSFYVYEYLRERDAVMYVMFLPYEWNEQMPTYDIRWNLPFLTAHFSIRFYLGLQKINITNYIENNESITMVIFGYGGNQLIGYFENHIIIYSKEANVSRVWLPQLIWSFILNMPMYWNDKLAVKATSKNVELIFSINYYI